MENIVEVVVPPLAQPLTYKLSETQEAEVQVGYRVLVPLGSRKANGFVVSKQHSIKEVARGYTLKELSPAASNQLCFNQAQLMLFNWVSEYYCEPLSNVIDTAIPAPASKQFERSVVLKKDLETPKRSIVQRSIVDFLQENSGVASLTELKKRFKNSTPAIKKLETLGVISIVSEESGIVQHWENPVPKWAKSAINLNPKQQEAFDRINSASRQAEFKTFLLHGITGSGKTEVYIECALDCIERGLGVLIIVPEIALTPQMVDRFRARLGDRLSLLHSGLTQRSRWNGWQALIRGTNLVALGTRSAVFAPVPKLGLIVVDEEHDQSFKQAEGLRYNARDLAIVRAKLENCPVVLGSATPSMESYFAAGKKRYEYIALPSRPGATPQPLIEIVDLNRIKPWEMASKNISPALKEAISQTLSRSEQVFILYNRRGFSSYLQCERCESVLECPNCSVPMTYHQFKNSLLCHYCNLEVVPPKFCSKCSGAAADQSELSPRAKKKPAVLVQRGAGTERVFDELKELFPKASIDRLDRDAATDHARYREILDLVRDGKTEILVGTQMIAKGHDLPGVTLVGIADCDVGLHLPDFRAAERVFQLLTQASGRAGRGENPGRVILQTRVPKHPALIKTEKKDFRSFAELELRTRKILSYPPFTKLLRVVASAQIKELALGTLTQVRKRAISLASKNGLKIEVLGPAPTPIEKIKARYRFHLVVKAQSISVLNQLLRLLKTPQLSANAKVRVSFDLDPQEML